MPPVPVLTVPGAVLVIELGGATADALVTTVQATWWNLPRAVGPSAHAVIAVACAAPIFAAVVLWGAAARARKLR